MKFSKPSGRAKKYPKIFGTYESVDYSNLFFAGTIAHSLDFRYSSGGFIHGFRYSSYYNLKYQIVIYVNYKIFNYSKSKSVA